MMKMKAFLAAAVVCLAGQFASADQPRTSDGRGPLWVCNLQFEGQARGFQVIVGKFEINGKGDLRCYAPNGDLLTIPVKLKMYSGPVALRVAFGHYDVYGSSADFALFQNDPYDMLGRYMVAQAQGSVIAGAGVITGVHADIPDVTLTFSLQFLRGLGLNMGITGMTIEADHSRL